MMKGEKTRKGLPGDQDLSAMIQKAVRAEVEPLRQENAQLRKSLEEQTNAMRHQEYVAIAKSDFSAMGDPEEVAKDFMAMESLPSGQRKRIIKAMRTSNALKKEAVQVLGKRIGANVGATSTGTASAEIHSLAKGLIAKGDGKMDLAEARVRIREMHPDLAAREAQEYNMGVV